MISLVSADLTTIPPVKIGSCVNLRQTCSNCSYVVVDSIFFPNNNSVTYNLSMTKSFNNYQFNFCNTSLIGDYQVNTCGDINGANPPICVGYSFTVNQVGQNVTQGQIILYIVLLLVAGGLAYGFYLFARNTEYEDVYNKFGELTQINYKKSIRLFLYGLAYLFFNWFVYIAYQISYGFLPSEIGITNILYALWLALSYSLIPILVIWFIIIVVSIFKTFINNAKLLKGYYV
jgi:hypothetical protein